jgi:DNA-binding NtrC family response regulator
MGKSRILLVDDNANTLKVLSDILNDDGYEVATARDGKAALGLFQQGPPIDAVVSDLKMPGMDGLELYHRLRVLDREIIFIITTAHGTIESSVKAMKEGVYDYLVKPINFDELSLMLAKAIRARRQVAELQALRSEVAEKFGFHNIVGQSPSMAEVFDIVNAVAPTDATVLVTGETGTGKELITKAVHYHSHRREAPIICVNCAALSESLLEAELFGYVKGAFTGAVSDRIGRLEAAHRGTLFLDEVGEMSRSLQAKLLRFLQERTFEPVGSSVPRTVDVRVIAATNRDLEQEVIARRFLPDLYYRLQEIHVPVPPLRHRGEDVLLLVDHFLRAASLKHRKPVLKVSPEAAKALASYSWPGNVRELSNTISRLVILGRDAQINLDDLPRNIRQAASTPDGETTGFVDRLPPEGISLRDVERELIRRTLELFHGHRSQTAKALGISRKSLYQKMLRLELESKRD